MGSLSAHLEEFVAAMFVVVAHTAAAAVALVIAVANAATVRSGQLAVLWCDAIFCCGCE